MGLVLKCFPPELLRFTKTERLEDFMRADDSCFHCQQLVLAYLSMKTRVKSWREDAKQVYALLDAKWTFEIPSEDADPMSFFWRAPPKGKRELGRQYRSTNQAYSAMMKLTSQSAPDSL